MNNLNDLELIKELDKGGMAKIIEDLPAQIKKGWDEVQKLIIPSYYLKADKILIAGMGGSGIAGALVQSLLEKENDKPIFVHRDYGIPGFVDNKTLVIAVSYSGETEEILDGFVQAYEKGAKLIAITTGGRLETLARKYKVPYYKFDYPSESRASMGIQMSAILGILKKIRLISDITQKDIDEAQTVLDKIMPDFKPEVAGRKNLAKKIAEDVFEHIPYVWASGILKDVARRWKCQFNENSKATAVFETLPELNHNTINDLDYPIGKKICVLILQSKYYHPRIIKQIEISREILDKKEISNYLIDIKVPGGPLSEMMANILLGDWVSYYLAMLHNVNPSEVPTIKYLKERLK